MGFSTLANIAFLQSSLVLNLFCFPKHHNRTLTILSETLVCLTKIIFAQLNLNINHKYLIMLIYFIQNRIKYKLILPYAVHFYCSFIHYNFFTIFRGKNRLYNKWYETIFRTFCNTHRLTYTKNLHILTYKFIMIELKGKPMINE